VPYDRFKSEDELLESMVLSLAYDVYPKITAIAGKKIHPDIDILQISKISEHQSRLTGYELKLMRYDTRSKGLGWSAFYKGLGQSLFYLRNGVYRVVLVLGFHENVSSDDMIDVFRDWMFQKKDLLGRILGSYLCVGTHLYKRGSFSPIIEANSDFSPPDDETKFSRDSLLHRRFTFDKKLATK